MLRVKFYKKDKLLLKLLPSIERNDFNMSLFDLFNYHAFPEVLFFAFEKSSEKPSDGYSGFVYFFLGAEISNSNPRASFSSAFFGSYSGLAGSCSGLAGSCSGLAGSCSGLADG